MLPVHLVLKYWNKVPSGGSVSCMYWHNHKKYYCTHDYVTNTPKNRTFEDSPIIYIHLQ